MLSGRPVPGSSSGVGVVMTFEVIDRLEGSADADVGERRPTSEMDDRPRGDVRAEHRVRALDGALDPFLEPAGSGERPPRDTAEVGPAYHVDGAGDLGLGVGRRARAFATFHDQLVRAGVLGPEVITDVDHQPAV